MDSAELVQQMESQLNDALRSLSGIPPQDAVVAQRRVTEARRSYDTLTDLLPKVSLSGKRRVDFLSKLADLRNSLIRAGEQI